MNRSVTRPSVSAIRSSNTTTLRLPASKDEGNPSCRCRLGISRFSYADCHVTRSGVGSIMPEAFRNIRATNVVFPQPVGPATTHVKGCFQRGSMSMNEVSSGRHILLQFQRCRAETVGEYFALPVEVRKCSFLLDVGHHGRITHAEAPIDPTTTPAIREHGEKGVFVDVLPLTQAFRAVLVGRAEAVVGLAAQTYESVTAPFYLEQARGPLVESLACEATRFCGRPRASGYTGADVFFLVIITAFSREPLRPVPEVVFAVLGSDEIIDGITGKCNVG